MDKKTISIISYITIIGWVVGYVSHNNSAEKASLSRYHLKQSLGVAIIGIIAGIIFNVLAVAIPALALVFSLVSLAVVVLWVFGIINAVNQQEKPVPIVGAMFENKFDFIK
jgi:uncharacterized membrane protein